MHFERAFPVVIVDEDVEARHASGRVVRQLAGCLEKRDDQCLLD